MASTELIVHFMEAGSNNMGTFQAFMGIAQNPRDSLSILHTGTTVVATISNVAQMLQPIRIVTNQLVATTALTRLMVDWKDPNKKVDPGDVLTLVSASGTIALTILALAEIGPTAAIAISAVVLASDLQSAFQPYLNSTSALLGRLLASQIQLTKPASTASCSLYWGNTVVGSGYGFYTYDEIMSAKGLFVCMTDNGASGQTFFIRGSPVPGSLTPVGEDAYKDAFCRNLAKEQGWSDVESGVAFCKSVTYK
ncbi:hypothetical protein [Paraburkholderia xenovorans]|uniref:hypothetical protein n=1 Tax=Paraburkholderia xenovorans TaxID=36873 RepID=UPI0015C55AD4|nr:hypothetical protein [Paraburkholderia xenovorans]NPT38707.1 hypothetical protein [Paraburkholderia xenovorans]